MIPQPIDTLELPVLLGMLRDHAREVIELIDADPLLKRREGGADGELVIANSAVGLYEPTAAHQLFAKGIVYEKDTLEFVSLPLVKMFNHGLREHNDATTAEVVARPGIRVVFPEKLDGTMIQLFAHAGRVWLSTRSVLEGGVRAEEGPYLALARGVLERDAPHLLDPEVVGRRTLVFELVHPKTRQVTRYGARESMVLLSVFDQLEWRYWPTREVLGLAEELGLERPALLLGGEDYALEDGVAALRERLEGDPSLPEGSIVCFEDGGQIVHRVKVKMQAYLEEFSMRFNVSLKTVAGQVWDRPELHDWDAYRDWVAREGLSDEEVEAFYREHHDTFTAWLGRVKARHAGVLATLEALDAELGEPPDDRAARGAFFKAAAAWAKEHAGDDFALVMQRLRKGRLRLADVMWADPLYPGFRGELSDVVQRGKG